MKAGDLVAGRFDVQALAGQGGMAEVYRALDRTTQAPVAIKVLTRTSMHDVDRFMREVALLETLDDPGIVRPIHHGRLESGAPYLVMEWLEGEDLASRLDQGPLDIASSVALGLRIARALAVAHAHGIVHRDIKPSNVLLVGDLVENAKLIDFGVAREIDREGNTATGLVVGTPGYMSPEQARGDATLDSRADIFALGCVLYECITGAPPFVGDHPVAVLAKILMAEPVRLSHARAGIPGALDDLIVRMLSKNRDDRPRDGAAVARELERIVEDAPEARISRPSTLTAHEQQVVSIVLVLADDDASIADTLSPEQLLRLTTRARQTVTQLGALFEVTVDGSIVCVPLADSPTDKAILAARAALALARVLPGRTIALATGRALVAPGSLPMGRVIDDAVALAKRATGVDAIVLDETTRSLIGTRFVLSNDQLVGERNTFGARTILGKRTVLVGRARELRTIMGQYEEALYEHTPRAALVVGAPGVGKTRLAEEVLASFHTTNTKPFVWLARGDPVGAGSAFGIAGQLVRSAIGEDVDFEKLRTWAKDRLPEGTEEFLAELVRVDIPQPSVRLSAARADAMVMSDQLVRAFADFANTEARKRPVVIVVDDLHWGDLPSIKVLDALLRGEEEQMLFLLALARPEVHETFPALWNERHVTRLVLGGLQRRAAEQLVRTVLGAPDDAIVERIVSRADGNPFAIEELLRAESRGKSDTTPDTVLAMAQRRLEGLDPDARHVLRAASVFGMRFWKNGLLALLGEAKSRTIETSLDQLAQSEVIASARSSRLFGEDEYEFRHAVVQDAAYAMLTDADRQLGHRLAAVWLEEHGERDPLALAVHAERGGDPTSASAWYLQAADQALEGTDLKGAIDRAERVMIEGASREQRGNARRIQSEASFWSGDQQAARTRADEALASLDAGTLAWFEAALFALSARAQLGDATGMLALMDTVRRIEPREDARVAKLQTTAVAAGYLCVQGQADLGDVVLRAIERDAMDASALHPGVLARFSVSRAILAYVRGDLGAYIEGTRNAAQLFLASGELRRELTQRANLAHALTECGSWALATRIAREVENGAARIGLAHTLACARQNLGLALAMQGDFAEAEKVERAALEEFERGGHKRLEGASHVYLAQIALASGDAKRAIEIATRALSSFAPLRPYATAVLASALLKSGKVTDARKHAKLALDELDDQGGVGEGTTHIVLAAAECALAQGAREEAKALAHRGAEQVRTRGSTLERSLRDTFFGCVPENVRLLELERSLA